MKEITIKLVADEETAKSVMAGILSAPSLVGVVEVTVKPVNEADGARVPATRRGIGAALVAADLVYDGKKIDIAASLKKLGLTHDQVMAKGKTWPGGSPQLRIRNAINRNRIIAAGKRG